MVKLGLIYVFVHLSYLLVLGSLPEKNQYILNPNSSLRFECSSLNPIAENDTFYLPIGCGNDVLVGNFLNNDVFDTIQNTKIYKTDAPQIGTFSCGPNGNFIFKADSLYNGQVTFSYRIFSSKNFENYSMATLTIYVEDDYDCDNTVNSLDIDIDNDGILNTHEGNTETDSDNDGIPNCFDIDSDNDGIPDFTEWQHENSNIELLLVDSNNDGWDDAFDSEVGGEYYEQVDTDQDGIADFIDLDSDNDGVEDYIEAYTTNNDSLFKLVFSLQDDDKDGLDNTCDSLNAYYSRFNPIGSYCLLPDFNNNGIRDWRDNTNYPVKGEGEEQEALEALDNKILVYPNPTSNQCKIILPQDYDNETLFFDLKLYDTNGKMLIEKRFDSAPVTLNLHNLNSGIYIIQLKTESEIYHSKIFKSM